MQQNFLLKSISIDAKKAYERAQKRLESFKENPEVKSDVDTLRARAALERAKARLKATKTDIG